MTEETERLVRIETKLDQLLEIAKDHETRIRTVEKWQSVLFGASAIVGAGSQYIIKIFNPHA